MIHFHFGTGIRKTPLFLDGSPLGLVSIFQGCATPSIPVVTRECADGRAKGQPGTGSQPLKVTKLIIVLSSGLATGQGFTVENSPKVSHE